MPVFRFLPMQSPGTNPGWGLDRDDGRCRQPTFDEASAAREGTVKRPSIISTPYQTSDELARRFGISKKRQKELDAMLEKGKVPKARKTASGKPSRVSGACIVDACVL
jgi:hypothetical protein